MIVVLRSQGQEMRYEVVEIGDRTAVIDMQIPGGDDDADRVHVRRIRARRRR